MSSGNTIFGESFYRDVWTQVQDPGKRKVIEALKGENQLEEEDVLERVDMPENKFYEVTDELEDAGVLDHYDQEHSRGHQTTEMSLYSVFYPVETALEFDEEEEYVQHMLDQDEEMLGEYQR